MDGLPSSLRFFAALALVLALASVALLPSCNTPPPARAGWLDPAPLEQPLEVILSEYESYVRAGTSPDGAALTFNATQGRLFLVVQVRNLLDAALAAKAAAAAPVGVFAPVPAPAADGGSK